MLKEFALIGTAFAVGFGLIFFNVPIVSSTLSVLVAPMAGPASSFVVAITPHIQNVVSFIKQSPQIAATLFMGGCTLTGFIINWVKNRQMIKQQQQAMEKQNQLRLQALNADVTNTQLQTSKSTLEQQVQTQQEKLKLYENYFAQTQELTNKMDGIRQETTMEIDTRIQSLSEEFNRKLRELENKKVATYVP